MVRVFLREFLFLVGLLRALGAWTIVLLVWRREDYSVHDRTVLRKQKLLRFFTVVAGFVFLAILMMPHPFSFSAIQLQVYFWICVFLLLLVIAFGLVAFYVGRDLPLPSVGLFVLGAALLVSCIRLLDIMLDGWRLADVISYDPSNYTGYADSLFLKGVVPVIAGWAFVLFTFALSSKALNKRLRAFSLLLVGTVIAGLGAVFLSDAYGYYVNPSSGVWGSNAVTVTSMLRGVFQVYMLAGVVWIFAGASLAVIALHVAFGACHLRAEGFNRGQSSSPRSTEALT